jgi:hypothetical protein
LALAQVTQDIIEDGRDEDVGRGLGEHDLVLGRRDRIEYLAVPGALGNVETSDLVVEAAVAAV